MSLSPAIICVAPNGARKQKADHPAVPLTCAEIAHEAAKCAEAGAAMIHIHVRDQDGKHLLDVGAYQDVITAIRQQAGADMILQITTEAVGIYTPAQQMAVVKGVKPEAASVALRELAANDNDLKEAEAFYAWMAQEGVQAQHILYSPSDVQRFLELRERGVIPDEKPFLLFVLGRYGFGESDPAALSEFVAAVRQGGLEAPWAVCAFGPSEGPAACAALGLGGHVRVGFENNTTLMDGRIAPDNAALVQQTAQQAVYAGRGVASGRDARNVLVGTDFGGDPKPVRH